MGMRISIFLGGLAAHNRRDAAPRHKPCNRLLRKGFGAAWAELTLTLVAQGISPRIEKLGALESDDGDRDLARPEDSGKALHVERWPLQRLESSIPE
jgi:hypothetical protein